jgi:hypothetical protein
MVSVTDFSVLWAGMRIETNSFIIYEVSSRAARRAALLQEPLFHPTPMVVPEAALYKAPLGAP